MSKPESQRIQKYLAARGIGSRRKIEQWISQGRITVNGNTAEPGQRVTANCQIRIDNKPVRGKSASEKPFVQRVIVYNKPEGEISTRSDPKGRPTVFKNLPPIKGQRWVAVGRLDLNTSGLMLFTNDGSLANHLMHPRLSIEREYMCRVFGEVGKQDLLRLREGVNVDGHRMHFANIKRHPGEGRNCWYSVTLAEGKYREVRRLWQAVGCQVSRLNRIRYGKIMLPRGLKAGGWLELSPELIELLAKNRDDDAPKAPRVVNKGRATRRR